MFQLDVAARSHRGLVRTTNEDSGFAGASLVLVADGVGGSNAGEVASSTAAHIAAGLCAHWPDTDPLALLGAVVDRASEQLRADVATAPDHLGASTTLTAIHTDGARFGLVHLGDSRAYLLRGRRLHRLTRDHTFVQQLVDAGHLTAEQARHSPYRHQVTSLAGRRGRGSRSPTSAGSSWCSATGCCCAATASPTSSTTTWSPACSASRRPTTPPSCWSPRPWPPVVATTSPASSRTSSTGRTPTARARSSAAAPGRIVTG